MNSTLLAILGGFGTLFIATTGYLLQLDNTLSSQTSELTAQTSAVIQSNHDIDTRLSRIETKIDNLAAKQ